MPKAPPHPPLVDRRFGDRRRPLPPRPLIEIVWPLGVGLCLGLLAPEWSKLANGLGYWVERLLFPFALLAARPEFGYGAGVAKTLSKIALFLQFPVEGALAAFTLRRQMRLLTTISRLALLHLAAAVLLWLLERPHIR
ncbi:MAG: hypothetical protein ABR928_18480 [Terracidiphilus sp.]